jgi:hypothetical protein
VENLEQIRLMQNGSIQRWEDGMTESSGERSRYLIKTGEFDFSECRNLAEQELRNRKH